MKRLLFLSLFLLLPGASGAVDLLGVQASIAWDPWLEPGAGVGAVSVEAHGFAGGVEVVAFQRTLQRFGVEEWREVPRGNDWGEWDTTGAVCAEAHTQGVYGQARWYLSGGLEGVIVWEVGDGFFAWLRPGFKPGTWTGFLADDTAGCFSDVLALSVRMMEHRRYKGDEWEPGYPGRVYTLGVQ